ncbi:MAG: TlpA family protein disulfide reductase [Nitrospirae bacterium]|nr:TlpA family protein disulfide reductase [Nitrospirota bacterium]
MKVLKVFCLAVCFALLTGMGTNAPAVNDKKPVSPMEIERLDKTPAPDFSLKDLNGKSVSLSSFKGKVVLLNFWATWCPSCKAEMPSLNSLYNEMKPRGLEIVAVSTDKSLNDVKGYLSKKGLDFLVLMDESRSVTKQYKVFSLPTTFLIDKNGIIVEKFYGDYDWTEQEIKQKIEKLL